MAGFPDNERLDQLAARIRAAENAPKPGAGNTSLPGDGKSYRMSRLGFDFGVTVVVFVVVGWLGDRQFGSQPWGLAGMTIIGFAAGILNVWRGLGSYGQMAGPPPQKKE